MRKILCPKVHMMILRRLMAALMIVPVLRMPALAAGAFRTETGAVNMSAAYGVTTVLALLLAVGYGVFGRKKNIWLMFLHISVVVVNWGYFALAISKTLEEALLANRIAYLGSVFLPLCMLMTIAGVCRIRFRRWISGILLLAGVLVFLLAASPGYLDWYYQDAALVFVNGMAKLEKVYGPLHVVYLIYLLACFAMMLAVILRAIAKKKGSSYRYAFVLLAIVFLNIAIWFVEQLIYWEFELLSVSYIMSEFILMMLDGALQDYDLLAGAVQQMEGTDDEPRGTAAPVGTAPVDLLTAWPAVSLLTARETEVLRAIMENKRRKDIAAELNVTEHTVKKHTANIFSKFGVSNRNELFAKAEKEIIHKE